MQDFFIWLYTWFGNLAANPVYTQYQSDFDTNVFINLGLQTVASVSGFLLLYYLLLCGIRKAWSGLSGARFARLSFWVLSGLVLVAALGIWAVVAARYGTGITENNQFLVMLGLMNSLFAALLYFVLSILLRFLSMNARFVPF
jgi:hypothetical protein